MVETLYFIAGFALCALPAWYVLHIQDKRYSALQADFRHLVNEFSIRTGGRVVFRPEKKVSQSEPNDDILGDDRYGILLPSMAEEHAEAADERAENDSVPTMSASDFEHLKKTGVIQ